MSSDPPLHVALGPDLRRPSVRLLKVIRKRIVRGVDFERTCLREGGGMYTRPFIAGQCTAVQYAMDLPRSTGHGG